MPIDDAIFHPSSFIYSLVSFNRGIQNRKTFRRAYVV